MTKRFIIPISLFMAITIATSKSQAQEIYLESTPSAAVQLRSNLLYDVALAPSIGIEIQTDLGLAWQLDYAGAWWNKQKKNHYYSCYGFQTELRYYIDSMFNPMPYAHHHVGLYGQMLTYDFEFGNQGYQCNRLDNTYGVGISYGYTLPISKHWAFDFTLGVGYFHSKYEKYVPTAYGYRKTGTKILKYGGPTKLEITAVWYINSKYQR